MLMPGARRDPEDIYRYIAEVFQEPGTASDMADALEERILSLEELPRRCAERKHCAWAKQGYRQLFVKNYIVLFRIDEEQKTVIIVIVRYSRSDFQLSVWIISIP